MDTVTVDVDGQSYEWSASLIGFLPGPVVQIELCVEQKPVRCARIFPPYHTTEGVWLQALSEERLAAAVLALFGSGQLEITAAELLTLYDEFERNGLFETLPDGVPICVHPKYAA